MKAQLIGAAVIFGLGGIIGHAGGHDAKVDFVKIPQKVYVTKTKTIHDTKPMSAACKKTLDASDAIYRAGSKLDSASTRQVDLLHEARQSMAEQDMTAMGKVLEKQWKFDNSTIDATQKLELAQETFESIRSECK